MRHIAEVMEVEFSSLNDPFFALYVAFRLAHFQREMARELEVIAEN